MKLNKENVLKQLNFHYYNFIVGDIDLSLDKEGILEICSISNDKYNDDLYSFLNKEKQEELYQILGFILGKDS